MVQVVIFDIEGHLEDKIIIMIFFLQYHWFFIHSRLHCVGYVLHLNGDSKVRRTLGKKTLSAISNLNKQFFS